MLMADKTEIYKFTILSPSQMVLPNPESESTRGHEIYSHEGDRVRNAWCVVVFCYSKVVLFDNYLHTLSDGLVATLQFYDKH